MDLLRRSVRQGTALSRQLLSLSRNPARHDILVEASSLVAGAIRLIQAILPSSIDLVAGPVADATVRVDPGQFDQVMLNLALNARDAMTAGGTLTISVSTKLAGDLHPTIGTLESGKPFVIFGVTDTGTGIDATVRPRLFEPFFTTKEHLGTGLGLAVVAEIVARFRGAIQVDTRLGAGTTFSIVLPTCDE
jgi:signal transduction histidine kinase